MNNFFEELKEDYVHSKTQLTFREVWEVFKERYCSMGKSDNIDQIDFEFGLLLRTFGVWLANYEQAKSLSKYSNWTKEELRKEIHDLNEIVASRIEEEIRAHGEL